MAPSTTTGRLVAPYIELGLALGRHIDGFVDGNPQRFARRITEQLVPDDLQQD